MKNNIHFTVFPFLTGILMCCIMSCSAKEKQVTDRAMYNLTGAVASCKITSFPCTIKEGEIIKETDGSKSLYCFSKEGLLTQFGSDTPLEYDKNGVFIPNEKVDSVIRNEKGQLIKLVYKEDEEGNSDSYIFEYNENGTLRQSIMYGTHSCWEDNYTYNAEGQVTEEFCADGYDGGRQENKYTYEYKKMDIHGNWVIRMSRNVANGQDYYEECEIEYYKE